MMKQFNLRELVNECAQLHSNLSLDKPSDIRRNVVAVHHAIRARKEYEELKKGR